MRANVLPSWNDGAAKNAIVDFVTASASRSSPLFIPETERIAAFDNDGTLWVERPLPVQAPFIVAKLQERARHDPSLADTAPGEAILGNNEAFERALVRQEPKAIESLLAAIGAAWKGTTPGQFEADVKEYLATHRHERFDRPFTDLVYQPMLELFDFLRAHDYRTYVCSGGGRDFMRAFCEKTWGLLEENVIGSAPEYEYRDGWLIRQPELHGKLALGPGKPEDIFARTGRVARFAAGNSDIDEEMLEIADFQLVIVHDDPDREYAYTEGARELLATADRSGWTMVSMKNDWKGIF